MFYFYDKLVYCYITTKILLHNNATHNHKKATNLNTSFNKFCRDKNFFSKKKIY